MKLIKVEDLKGYNHSDRSFSLYPEPHGLDRLPDADDSARKEANRLSAEVDYPCVAVEGGKVLIEYVCNGSVGRIALFNAAECGMQDADFWGHKWTQEAYEFPARGSIKYRAYYRCAQGHTSMEGKIKLPRNMSAVEAAEVTLVSLAQFAYSSGSVALQPHIHQLLAVDRTDAREELSKAQCLAAEFKGLCVAVVKSPMGDYAITTSATLSHRFVIFNCETSRLPVDPKDVYGVTYGDRGVDYHRYLRYKPGAVA